MLGRQESKLNSITSLTNFIETSLVFLWMKYKDGEMYRRKEGYTHPHYEFTLCSLKRVHEMVPKSDCICHCVTSFVSLS
jgi:hypothetical protein